MPNNPGRPKQFDEERVSGSWRMSKALHARIIKQAHKEEMNATKFVVKVFEEYLERRKA